MIYERTPLITTAFQAGEAKTIYSYFQLHGKITNAKILQLWRYQPYQRFPWQQHLLQ